MRSIGRSVRSVCIKKSKIRVQKIIRVIREIRVQKNSDLWFILVEHEIIVFEHELHE